ncbi:MAG: nucleoside recognition domain-containing protein [Lachnospiraceae bacterium]
MGAILNNISKILIPLLIFYVLAYGLSTKTRVYEEFVKGAKSGIFTVFEIMPTLIALMIGVGILRASGFLEFIGNHIGVITQKVGLPSDIISLMIIKVFSSSAATGLLLDIYKVYGTDSFVGMLASILCSCTETIFYTMSVYFIAAKVTKTKWTLLGAVISTLAGIIASICITYYLMN